MREEIREVEQPKIEKVELKALTCAGYVRFYDEFEEDTPFAVFMNPQRINHRNRKGIELKRFDGTMESLKFGTKA